MLTAKRPQHDRLPLQVLADELHVHVRTLRAAAHDGRLAATFGPRPYFGKLTATATREAGARFMATWYRRTYGRGRRRLVEAGIMLLDRSGSMKPNLELEVRAAETFIHGMLAEDRLRIGNFGKDIVIEPDDFTSDRDALFKVLHGDLQRDGPTPLWNAIDRAIDKLLLEKSRRVVLALSDGVDEPLDFSGHAKSMKDEMKRAEDNDIMIYAVGMEGLAPMPQQRATQGFGGRGIMPQRRNEPPMQKPDEGMAKIAAATGGGYFELTSPGDLLGKFDRVIDELHHQYALGFVPQKLDGKLHDLTVKVNKSGYTVRARKRYLAPRG